MSRDSMLPSDSASWRELLVLDQLQPVTRSPFLSSTVKQRHFATKEHLKNIPLLFLLMGIPLCGALLYLSGDWHIQSGATIKRQPEAISTMVKTIASHGPVYLDRSSVPPPPEPIVDLDLVQPAPAAMQPVKNNIQEVGRTLRSEKTAPRNTTVSAADLATFNAAAARVNENTVENTRPAIQVRKINPKEIAPVIIKEEVLHE